MSDAQPNPPRRECLTNYGQKCLIIGAGLGIDLDERNYDLALDRVGPFILTRGEIAA